MVYATHTKFHTLKVPEGVEVLDEAVLRIRPELVQAIVCRRSISGYTITLTLQGGASVDVHLWKCLSSTVAHTTTVSFEEQISRY